MPLPDNTHDKHSPPSPPLLHNTYRWCLLLILPHVFLIIDSVMKVNSTYYVSVKSTYYVSVV